MTSLRDKLSDLNREDLLALVERMVHRDPELVALLDAPQPGRACQVRNEDIDAQVELAMLPALRGGWRESAVSARAAQDIAALGRAFLDAGETENAVTVFGALSAGIRARYDGIHDEESGVGRVIDECVDGLEACLGSVVGEPRRIVLDALIDIAVWDAASGGYGVGERSRSVVVERTTDAERQELAARVEPTLKTITSSYSRQRIGTLLVRLRGDALDEEQRLGLLRETANHSALIDLLLQLHRVSDARVALEGIEPWIEVVKAADTFTEHGYADVAAKVLATVAEVRRSTGRWLAVDWLARFSKAQGDRFAAPRWAEELFVEQPTVEHWMQLRAVTKEMHRVQLRHRLAADAQHLLLVEILLAENKPREALAKFRAVKERNERALRAAVNVADGVARTKPREAAALYAEVANAHAERGNAEEYDIAVDLIRRGRDALRAAGHVVLAQRYLDDFRRRHVRRRGLLQRLDDSAAE